MANTYLTRSLASTNTSWTFSAWVKRSGITATNYLISWGNSGTDATGIGFASSDELFYYSEDGGDNKQRKTSAKYRDTNAFYHIVCKCDANAITLYVNGEEPTQSWTVGSSANPLDTSTMAIGKWVTSAYYHNGSMSHIHFIDGTAYDATAFGQYDANGVWTIKTSPSVTYGTNGFFILKDGNSVTDQSGEGNNFTVAGGTLTNTEDNPSNVFATLNPLVNNAGAMMALTKGNLTCESTTTSPAWKLAVSTLGMSSGKYYWEVKFDNVHNSYNTGVLGSNILVANTTNPMNQTGYTGFYNIDGGEIKKDGSDTTADYGTYATNDIMGIACDMDNYTITFYKNGVAHVSDVTLSTTGRDMVFPCSVHYQTNGGVQSSYNFGNGYFGTTAVSSAGTNASGNGIFEYDVPTGGYTALSTKGLNL